MNEDDLKAIKVLIDNGLVFKDIELNNNVLNILRGKHVN
jgi:hypothetical protein